DEAGEAASALGIEFIAGVEVSVTWAGHTLHIVGLRIDPSAKSLSAGLEKIRAGRGLRASRMSEGLAGVGIDGALEGARSYAKNPQLVSRTHFARFLVDRGHARDMQAVFKRYLTAGHPGYVPHQWATMEEALAWIGDAGGVAVLAHPGRYRMENWQREEMLERFKALGGVAVEVVTGSHTPDQYVYWAKAAQRHGLLASCGSDFHGPEESYRDVGELPPLPAGCNPVWSAW
ncbi:MAG TPA: PHP domain-containing protein, partial [Burkholderiales bacterium]|nr:PHP domain-containing protein [Burkholderiales bacterium]